MKKLIVCIIMFCFLVIPQFSFAQTKSDDTQYIISLLLKQIELLTKLVQEMQIQAQQNKFATDEMVGAVIEQQASRDKKEQFIVRRNFFMLVPEGSWEWNFSRTFSITDVSDLKIKIAYRCIHQYTKDNGWLVGDNEECTDERYQAQMSPVSDVALSVEQSINEKIYSTQNIQTDKDGFALIRPTSIDNSGINIISICETLMKKKECLSIRVK